MNKLTRSPLDLRCSSPLLYIFSLILCVMALPQAGAAVIAYDLLYPSPVLFKGNTTFEVTAYFDDANITGASQEDILLNSLLVKYQGPAFPSEPSRLFANNVTTPCTFVCGGQDFEPFTGRFQNGNFTGYLQGRQPVSGSSPFWVAWQGFGNQAQGNNTSIIFFGSHPTQGNAEVHTTLRANTINGPYLANVPLPPALWLLLSAVALLISPSGRR